MCEKSVKTNLLKPLESMSSILVHGYGGTLRRKGVNTAVHHLEPFSLSHLEVGPMCEGFLFLKESDFVSFISILRREGKQLQNTDKINSLK